MHTTIEGNMKAEWGEYIPTGEYEGGEVYTTSVTISFISPIKYIKVTGITKDGSCKIWQKVFMDKFLGDSTLAQLITRVEQKLKDKGLYDQYWLTYKLPTEEEIAELDPLTYIWEKKLQ